MLADYHNAKNAMETSWENVPSEFREGVLPPFESQGGRAPAAVITRPPTPESIAGTHPFSEQV
jgi:hypothetical protein